MIHVRGVVEIDVFHFHYFVSLYTMTSHFLLTLPAFQLHPLRWTDKFLCRFFGAPATLRAALGFSLIT